MSTTQHNLKVKLALAWEHGDEYKATVTVTTTDTCYHAGDLKVGLPPHQEGTGLVEYLSFYFTHEGDKCGQIVRDVSKSIVVKIPYGQARGDGVRGGQRTRRRAGGRACAEEEGGASRGEVAAQFKAWNRRRAGPLGQPKGVRSLPPYA